MRLLPLRSVHLCPRERALELLDPDLLRHLRAHEGAEHRPESSRCNLQRQRPLLRLLLRQLLLLLRLVLGRRGPHVS